MGSIRVSIITACYNSEKSIHRTIDSVLEQTYKNIEYIIIDGKSTDRTVDIIKGYVSAGNRKLKYISERDKGIYDAFNKGLRMATGKIIGIINSDDYYEPDAVGKVVAHMTDSPYQVIYGYCNFIKGKYRKEMRIHHDELERHMIPHPACFVTRKTYCKYGMFIEYLKIASDYELMMRFHNVKSIQFIQIPEVLANFTEGGISTKKEAAPLIKIEMAVIYYKYHIISFGEFLEKIVSVIFI